MHNIANKLHNLRRRNAPTTSLTAPSMLSTTSIDSDANRSDESYHSQYEPSDGYQSPVMVLG